MSARRRRIVYTEAAAGQLGDVLLFSERTWGTDQRLRYARTLALAIRAIAENPQLGRQHEELAPGLRAHIVRSHIIYYWPRDTTIVIAAVMHVRQDPLREAWNELGTDEPAS